MALLPSIMSLFGSRTPQVPTPSAEQQTAVAGANPTVPSQETLQSNGQPVAIPAVQQGEASPLANFADLWKTDPNNNQQTPSLVPNFNLDPAGLMTAAKKVNFTNHISPEVVTKAMAGDQQAFLQVINEAAQLGFANATAASGELVKQSLSSAQGILKDQVLPGAFREQAISQAMNESNPIFNDPAVSPILGMLKSQLQVKYPTTSPQEIASMATQFLSGMSNKIVTANGGTVTPKGQTTNQTGFPGSQETDWTTYFS